MIIARRLSIWFSARKLSAIARHDRDLNAGVAPVTACGWYAPNFRRRKNCRAQCRPASTDNPCADSFVTVQEGCDKFCTFCVVPYTRGAEGLRATADIVAEARALATQGVCEVTLLGQNVNAWQDRESGLRLDGLLAELAQIEGIERLRFTTSHPRDMDAALIAAHGHNAKLMPYLHLPVQSGSDPILKAMNAVTRAQYLDLVAEFRRAR